MSCFQELQDAVRKVNSEYDFMMHKIGEGRGLDCSDIVTMFEAIKHAIHEIATEIVLIGAEKKK